MTQMCTHFKTDVAQNRIGDVFLTLTVRGPFSEKTEAMYVELNERTEAATNDFSST